MYSATAGSATLVIDTYGDRVTAVVDAVPVDRFVLRAYPAHGRRDLDGAADLVYAVGCFWRGFVEWHAGDQVPRGLTDEGFSLSDPAVATLYVGIGRPDEWGDFGAIEVTMTCPAAGTTQLMWNGVPGPELAVE